MRRRVDDSVGLDVLVVRLDLVELNRPGQEVRHVLVLAYLCDACAWHTLDVPVMRVVEVVFVRFMWLDLSRTVDVAVESGAHLRRRQPRFPHDLVGVVAQRHPDAFLLKSASSVVGTVYSVRSCTPP